MGDGTTHGRGAEPAHSGRPVEAAAERRRLGAAFATGGADYARLRPDYPAELVAWLAGPPGDLPVLDVGAGTGKLTGVLLGLGHRVVAVDPSADMLAQLRGAYPHVTARAGTGESTGLPDGTAGAALFGQSWHWVDPVAGTREAARVVVPGGALGLVWNYLDDAHPGAAALEDAMHALHDGPGERDDSFARVGPPFEYDGRREAVRPVATTTAALAALVTTRSYYLARPEPERAYLRARCAAAVAQHFGTVGDTPVAVPYRSIAHRFRRP